MYRRSGISPGAGDCLNFRESTKPAIYFYEPVVKNSNDMEFTLSTKKTEKAITLASGGLIHFDLNSMFLS